MFNKHKRKIAILTVLTIVMGILIPGNVNHVQGAEETKAIYSKDDDITTIKVLSTTDMHGKFKNFEYATMSEAAGGMNQVAKVIKEERDENTLVIDNGDNIQGNYNHLFLTKDYLNNNINPMVLGLTEAGYDAFVLGNHEFNYGMDTLFTIAKQLEDGNVNVLTANLYKDGKRVFKPYVVKEVGGVRVAIIGVVTPHITKWDTEKLIGYEPTNPAEEVKKVIDDIKEKDEADIFIVSAHVGLNNEYGDGDSAMDIANLNPEVSMIVAGHSHESIKSQIVNGVLITQPKNFGTEVSKVEIDVKKTDKGVEVVDKRASLTRLTKTSESDPKMDLSLEKYHNEAIKDATKIIGTLVGENLAKDNEVKDIPQSFISDEGVTDFINEVQLYYSDKHLQSIGIDTSKIHHVSGAAMLSVKANLLSGDISKSDLANIYKFDNKLYTIKTTGKQIKTYLEWTANIYNTFKEGDLTVSFNPKFESFKYDMLQGVSYQLNISKPVGQRVENLRFTDGNEVKDTDEVYLTVNDYRYNSNLALIFDQGEYEKIYESTNDSLSDIRDMIAEYIEDVKGGVITRNVDNNWSLTGITYNEPLRSEVVKLINEGVLTQEVNYSLVAKALTVTDCINQLEAKGKVQEVEKIKSLVRNKIDVISFNDFHGSVIESGTSVGAAKLAGYINSHKNNISDVYNFIPVSGGDMYQGTAISNLKVGAPVSDMLREIGLEVSAVGNHEFDWDRANIAKWANEGGFTFLSANMVYKANGELVEFADPYKIVERNGVKVGFIGIATPATATQTLPANVEDIEFLDPIETVDKWAPKLRAEGADVIIALTHCPVTQEKDGKITGEAAEIAANAKDVDAVIGAHNHAFVNGKVNNRPVVQAGNNGKGVSTISFTFDGNKKLVDLTSETIKFASIQDLLPVDETVDKLIKSQEESLKDILKEKVTYIDEALDHTSKSFTKLGTIISETMRKVTNSEIALTNGGGIRRGLEKGDVTVGDMYELMPFDNTLVTMDLKGCDIVKAIEHGIAPQGFGWGQFSGVKVWYDEETNKITSIRLTDGTPLDMNKYYKVVVNDYMSTGGSNYDFTAGKNVNETNIVMRDAISKYWKENGMPSVEDDLLIAGEDTTIKNPSIDIPGANKPEVDIPSEDNSSTDILEENNNSNNTLENKVENLISELEDKKTGDDINIEVFAFVSLMAIAVTIMFFSNKKRKTI